MPRTLLQATLLSVTSVATRSGSIPAEEIDVLVVAATAAVLLADRGAAADGYVCLIAARRRAERLLEEGHPWAAALVEQYGLTAGAYADRCWIARE